CLVALETALPGAPPGPWHGVQYLSYQTLPAPLSASSMSSAASARLAVPTASAIASIVNEELARRSPPRSFTAHPLVMDGVPLIAAPRTPSQERTSRSVAVEAGNGDDDGWGNATGFWIATGTERTIRP